MVLVDSLSNWRLEVRMAYEPAREEMRGRRVTMMPRRGLGKDYGEMEI